MPERCFAIGDPLEISRLKVGAYALWWIAGAFQTNLLHRQFLGKFLCLQVGITFEHLQAFVATDGS